MQKLKFKIKDSLSLKEILKIARCSVENQLNINPNVICKIKKTVGFEDEEIKGVKKEFQLILLGNRVDETLRLLQEIGILSQIIPELSKCYKFNQYSKYHNRDVFEHILSVTSIVPKKLNLRLSALLHDVSKPICFTMDSRGRGHFYGHEILSEGSAKDILARFDFDQETIDNVALLIRNHMKKFSVASKENLNKLINLVGMENTEDILELQIADDLSKNPKYVDVKPLICLYKILKDIN